MSALKLDTVNKRFLLKVDKERLESAPGFDKDDWPDMADPTWQNTIHSYYGTKSYTDAKSSVDYAASAPRKDERISDSAKDKRY